MQFDTFVTVLDPYGVCIPIHPDLLNVKLKLIQVMDVDNPG